MRCLLWLAWCGGLARSLQSGDEFFPQIVPSQAKPIHMTASDSGAQPKLKKLADARAAAMAKKNKKASTAKNYLALRRKQQAAQAYLAQKGRTNSERDLEAVDSAAATELRRKQQAAEAYLAQKARREDADRDAEETITGLEDDGTADGETAAGLNDEEGTADVETAEGSDMLVDPSDFSGNVYEDEDALLADILRRGGRSGRPEMSLQPKSATNRRARWPERMPSKSRRVLRSE